MAKTLKLSHHLTNAIAKRGVLVGEKLGEGAEGVVFDVINNRAIKCWFDDPNSSLDVWLKASALRLSSLPMIFDIFHIKLDIGDEWFDKSGAEHREFTCIVMERVRPITSDINVEPFIEVAAPYQSLNDTLGLINILKYQEAIDTAEFDGFAIDLVRIHKLLIDAHYHELSPQFGLAADGRLVVMDMI